jgi:hypothetical protein
VLVGDGYRAISVPNHQKSGNIGIPVLGDISYPYSSGIDTYWSILNNHVYQSIE